MSELARRVLFAVVAAPATVWLIYLGGPYLGILSATAAALGAWELFRIARAGGVDPIDTVGIPFAALLPLLASLAPRVAVTLFGVVYTGGMLSFGVAIRYDNYAVGRTSGTLLLLLPILLTWMNDIGAYALGRLFGRRKLMPTVS